MIADILDCLFLNKDTKELKKINNISQNIQYCKTTGDYEIIKGKLLDLQTVYHKDKVSLLVNIIDATISKIA